MKFVVTGASGGFAREAIDLLLPRIASEDLILVTRDPDRVSDLAARGLDVRRGDFDEPAGLEEAFAGADRMLLISTRDVGRRADQHATAIRAAGRAGVTHVVYTSSDGVDSGSPALIAPDHRRTEELLVESGLDYTIMRNSLYAEAAAFMMIPASLRSGELRMSTGDGRVGFIPRPECVACAIEVLTGEGHRGRTYRIANEQNWSLAELAVMASDVLGVPITYVPITTEERDAELAAAGVPAHYEAGLETAAYGSSARDDLVTYESGIREHYFGTTSRDVRTLLGRGPTPLRDVLVRSRDLILDRAAHF
jgi:NAD(P)H dehydrogenase (quinone)